MNAGGRVARVLLDSALPQLDHLFDYRVPHGLLEQARPGVRVKVPFRSAGRIADGYLIEFADADDYEGVLSDIDSVTSPVPVLAPEVWALARRVADRSAGTANDVVRLAVPPRAVRVEKAWLAARDAASTAAPAATPGGTSGQTPGGSEVAALEPSVLEAAAFEAAAFEPAAIRGYPDDRIEAAIEGGERLALQAIPRLAELPGGVWVGEWAVTLAQAAARCWAGGRTAILVVPDYRDQDQLSAALAVLAPAHAVARVDARQPNPERYRAFLECLAAPRIVVGNRSAIYAPAERLGLIAVWDDGDPLHSEPLSPYVHARDAALVRQEQQGAALVFAGHTRSVEVQRLVEVGWLHDIPPARAIVPRIIPTAQQAPTSGFGQAARIPSTAWREAGAALEHGPVLVQVARPGYAPVLACQHCRQAARCNHCEGPLGLATGTATPSCGWCGALAAGWVCDNCEHTLFRLVSIGAGRTAEELGRAFPGVRIIVADGDHPLLTVGAEPALIIATRGAEPIAAGGYRAILLLDGERMLARETLRVADDCLRWWSNAAVLAAPGAPTMLVGVSGSLAQTLATWQQVAYAVRELTDRRELRFPPAVRLASVTGAAEAVAAAVGEVPPGSLVDALGPAPLPDGSVRTILRFDYAHGAAVAAALRSAVVRNATSRRRAPAGKGGYRPAPTLKVRFDDPEIL